ncbi:MAG: toxic anion resistance protein, partial [Acidimicrobiia bacterium]|nr:toxic anion resistance protein [Acidimicrobiia bacterium]
MTDAAAAQSLTPPAVTAGLVLQPPQAVTQVEPAKAGGMVPLDQAVLPGLDSKVADFVNGIMSADVHSPAFAAKASDIRTMGDDEIRQSSEVSNRLLQAPVRAMRDGAAAPTSKVSQTLLDLRRTVEDLDPKEATGVKKLLGLIPFGDKVADYFRKYESAQSHLDAILKALYDGQDELRKDNAALEQEKVHLWESMQRLAQYIYIAEKLDAALTTKIAEVELTDSDRAKVLKEDVLFYARQKHQDLLTQLAVSIQGYLAIDLIRKNNLELIKGVDRATTTTVAALRTAVIVAQAVAQQKLVLDQINALNTTTASMIESTSQLLASQSVDIQNQAANATLDLAKLQSAFANIYQAMDAIDTFKVQALDSMATTIGSLQTEIDKAQQYLSRVHRAGEQAPAASL